MMKKQGGVRRFAQHKNKHELYDLVFVSISKIKITIVNFNASFRNYFFPGFDFGFDSNFNFVVI